MWTGSLAAMKALGQAAFRPFLDRPGNLLKVSRIYRDARMHYPVPYKESLWLCIRQDVEWWAENPCLYFEIRPERLPAGFLFWKPKTAILEAFRQDLIARPEVFPKIAEKCRKATGLPRQRRFISVRSPAPFPNWSRILPGRATLNVRPPGSRGGAVRPETGR